MSIYQKYFDELNAKSAGSAVVTANWLIKIAQSGEGNESGGSITSSKIPNFTEYCDLFEFEFYMDRGIQKSATEQVKPDGGLNAGNLNIVTASSFLNADFNNIFHQNNCLEIAIIRIQSLQSESPLLVETYEFKTCYTTQLLVKGDIMAASFRYTNFSRTTSSTNNEGGKEGNVAASYNFVAAANNKPANG